MLFPSLPATTCLTLTSLLLFTSAVNPGCKCIRFTSTFGKEWGLFSSPDYPHTYSGGIRCLLYSFQAPKDHIVHIVLDKINLPPQAANGGCGGGDYLKFFLHLEEDGVNERTPWNSLRCGQALNSSYYSSERTLILQFHSATGTRAQQHLGFYGHFRFLNSSQFESNGRLVPGTRCDYQFLSANYTAAEGRFFSPNYPSIYPHNVQCSYFFHAGLHERVKIIFAAVALQPAEYSCLNKTDVIRVIDGPSSKAPVISLICNAVKEYEVLSTGSDLVVELISNSENPSNGFRGKFYFVKVQLDNPYDFIRLNQHMQSYEFLNFGQDGLTQASTLVPQCNQVVTSDAGRNGTFTSPNYPHPYASKTRCRYDFLGHGKERVQIVFTDFSLYHPDAEPKSCGGEDALSAFVHYEGNLARLAEFCGINTPLSLMSSGHRLTLEMNAPSSSRTSRGFSALYYFVEDSGIKTGRQLRDFPCAFVHNGSETQNGTFASPNFGGLYPRNIECHYFFHGQDGQHVDLHFTHFSVFGSGPCDESTKSDYVEFSNYMPVDKKYKRTCGTLPEFRVQSDGKFFRVSFRSNSILDSTGFSGSFSFCDKPAHKKKDSVSGSGPGPALCTGLWLIVILLQAVTVKDYGSL